LAAGEPLYAFVTEGYWCDIGNAEQYMQSQFDILEKKGTLLSLPGREASAGIWMGENVQVDASASLIPPVVIGDDCIIGPNASIGPLAVLGNGVQIRQGSSLKRCILWDNSMVGEGAELRGAVLGKGALLLSSARAFEGSMIGDRSVVGEGSVIKPGVKIWPEKWVEKGTRLSKSLVWGNCGRARLFGNSGITGDLFTEITPDFACCLGLALGSSLAKQGRLSLGSDGYPDTQVIKNAVLSGLMSSGLQVVDLRKVTMPVHRYGIRAFDLLGGVHIYRVGHNKINVRLMNDRGADCSRGEQRKVEGLLSREEYRYAMKEEIHPVEYLPDVNRSYINYLLKFLDRELIRRKRYRIVVDYDPSQLGALLPGLFDALGCQVITFAAPRTHSQTFSELLKAAEQFGEVVREQTQDVVSKRIGISHVALQAIYLMVNDLTKPPYISHNYRGMGSHSLQCHHPKGFVEAGKDSHIRLPVEKIPGVIIDITCKINPSINTHVLGFVSQIIQGRPLPGNNELNI
jgi:mannose-1-phosphate guanylyltransferase/phosphomannomutase